MTDNARIPYIGNAQLPYLAQLSTLNVVHLPYTIVGNSTPLLPGGILITEQPCKDLVYNYPFLHLINIY